MSKEPSKLILPPEATLRDLASAAELTILDKIGRGDAITSTELCNFIKAHAVMEFVNAIIAAYEAGFVEEHQSNLADLYRCAQWHVKDRYRQNAPRLSETWGEGADQWCKNGFSDK